MNLLRNYNFKILILALCYSIVFGGVAGAFASGCSVEDEHVTQIKHGSSMEAVEHHTQMESGSSMNAKESHDCSCSNGNGICSTNSACAKHCATAFLINFRQSYPAYYTRSRIVHSAPEKPAPANITAPFRPPRS